MDDLAGWLADFVLRGDEQAFALIVRRYVGLVYSSARRQLGDADLAEEATQAVFIVLAKKAESVKSAGVLAGWLVSTTRFVCQDLLKRQRRRIHHEQKAAAMKQEADDGGMKSAWEEMSPVLDEALSRLKEPERSAVTMRFLENREMTEVAAALGISREAAAKRIERALNKMRARLAGKGVVTSTAVISAVMAKHGMEAASSALNNMATTAGLAAAKGVAGGAAAVAAKGAIGLMAIAKAKTLGLAAIVLFLAMGVSWVVMAHRADSGSIPSPKYPPVKVGFLISNSVQDGTPNYLSANFAKRFLKNPSVDAYGLFEPGAQDDVPQEIRNLFPADHSLHAEKLEDLKKVEVIVAAATWNVPDNVIESITKAVQDGAGFFQHCSFNVINMEYSSGASTLNAIEDGTGSYWVLHASARCQVS